MSEIVGGELKRWSETLEELNEYNIGQHFTKTL